jgi:hypothetical protein
MVERGSADDEYWVLSTDAGQALLALVGDVRTPRPADVARWRGLASASRVAAAIRLAEGRRRGAAKFTKAEAMWFDPTGLEQATAEPVARHKAARFAGRARTVFDLCCGVGGDALTMAEGAGVVAVDLDEGMCRRARWNAGVYGVADRMIAVRARAEAVALPAGAWVHVDPDRRVGARARARSIEEYVPGLPFLRALAHSGRSGAIKLSPASDFDAQFGTEGGEVELVSLAGECKEATVWFGDAATCRRRATCLPAGATWTDRDGDRAGQRYAALGPVQGWVFDPDPSLARSGLLDGFALAHGLTRYVEGADFLTGPARNASPFLTAFEVLAVLPLDPRAIRRELSSRGVGRLEIKTRGVERRPEEWRARLRVPGEESATLILAAGGSTGRAVLARRDAGLRDGDRLLQ